MTHQSKAIHSSIAIPVCPVLHQSPLPFCPVGRWAQLLSWGGYLHVPIGAHFSRIFGLGSDCPSPKPNGLRSSLEPITAVVCRGCRESETTRLWEV